MRFQIRKASLLATLALILFPCNRLMAQEPDTTGTTSFVLSGGETLYSLSAQLNLPVDSILTLNRTLPASLQAGDSIRVPIDRLARRIRVASGETLFAISRKYAVSIDEIKKVNAMTSSNLRSGQTLLIPGQGGADVIDSVVFADQVTASMDKVGSGVAVVYPQNYIGRMTASGKRYNPELFVVSHPEIKTGSIVWIYSPDSDRETFAEVIDRAFSGEPQIIDVSEAVAVQLHLKRDGTDMIEMKAVEIIPEN